MIAPPPALIERCVEAGSPAAEHAVAFYDIAGSPAAVEQFAAEANMANWRVTSDNTRDGKRHLILRFESGVTWREIAGFIYSAQNAGLTLTGRFDPPICGTKEK